MTHAERSGKRSLLYSGWHRPASIARFVGRVSAAKLCMIDVDACEYCFCGTPVALIETQVSEHDPKPARVMTTLAKMAGLPAFSVSVRPTADGGDVASFLVRRLAPTQGAVDAMTPQAYAEWLIELRDEHRCPSAAA